MKLLIVLFIILACLGGQVNAPRGSATRVKSKKPSKRKWVKSNEEMWHPPKRKDEEPEPQDLDYYEDYFDDNYD
jgi:hypothetical protein